LQWHIAVLAFEFFIPFPLLHVAFPATLHLTFLFPVDLPGGLEIAI
jgi:hypothetical protein